MKHGKMVSVLLLFLTFIFLLIASGFLLDNEAERVVHQLYTRDKDGVISGLESIQVIHDNQNAVVFLHGLLTSPAEFSDVVNDIKQRVKADIFIPLLPYHARNLETAAKFDVTKITSYTKH